MHPYLTGAMAQAHIEDLHRDAARHRLIAEARAGRTGPVTAWRSTVSDAIASLRRAIMPTARACAAPPVCCPA